MCYQCEWEELLEDIDEMMEDDKYSFALDTLEGIKEWTSEFEHCTDKQREAIENIRESVGQ